jgi:MerR family transcriptional regulator, light-induced transcriptional regulator
MSKPSDDCATGTGHGPPSLQLTAGRSGSELLSTTRVHAQSARGHPHGTQPDRLRRQVHTLARLALASDAGVARDYVEDAQSRGYSVDGLCVDLLAPAARALGELWNEDRCSFVEVTVGTARLQGILHRLAPHFMLDAVPGLSPPHLLLAPTPGEQHTFGLQMVGEFFRRDGWMVHGGVVPTMSGICHAVAQGWFDVVGLSLSSESLLDTCAELIRQVRDISINPDLRVVIGGYLPAHRQDVASYVAADAASTAGTDAPGMARQLLAGKVIAA